MSHWSAPLAKPKQRNRELLIQPKEANLAGERARWKRCRVHLDRETEDVQLTCLPLCQVESRTQPWCPTTDTSLRSTSSHSATLLGFTCSAHSETTTNTICQAMLYSFKSGARIFRETKHFAEARCCVWGGFFWPCESLFKQEIILGRKHMCSISIWAPSSTKFNFQMNQRRLSFNQRNSSCFFFFSVFYVTFVNRCIVFRRADDLSGVPDVLCIPCRVFTIDLPHGKKTYL